MTKLYIICILLLMCITFIGCIDTPSKEGRCVSDCTTYKCPINSEYKTCSANCFDFCYQDYNNKTGEAR